MERKRLFQLFLGLEWKDSGFVEGIFLAGLSKLQLIWPQIHSAETLFQKNFSNHFRGLSKWNAAIWQKFFDRLVKIAFTCPEEYREDFLWKEFFLEPDPNIINIMARSFQPGLSKLHSTNPKELLRRSNLWKQNTFVINFGQWLEQFRPFEEKFSTGSQNSTVHVQWNNFSKLSFLRTLDF